MRESQSEQIGPFNWVGEKVREWSCRRRRCRFGGLSESILSFERTWFIEEPRAGIARVENWVESVEARLQSEVRKEVLSMFWGLDCLWRFQIIHNVLEIGNKYFSMNTLIIQNEQPTTRSLSGRVGDRKGSTLTEPALLTK